MLRPRIQSSPTKWRKSGRNEGIDSSGRQPCSYGNGEPVLVGGVQMLLRDKLFAGIPIRHSRAHRAGTAQPPARRRAQGLSLDSDRVTTEGQRPPASILLRRGLLDR